MDAVTLRFPSRGSVDCRLTYNQNLTISYYLPLTVQGHQQH